MRIADELLILTREHHQSLSLGNSAVNIHKSGDKVEIETLCLKVSQTFRASFQMHFNTEERTIFATLKNKSNELNLLCKQLTDEHQQLYQLAEYLPNQPEKLLEFGTLLKSHTRTEDRVLFPNIALLSSSEREAIRVESEQHTIYLVNP